MLIDTIIIAAICVFVIDLTDFFDIIFEHIWKLIYKNTEYHRGYDWTKVCLLFHPFFCSLCAAFWCNLVYIICAGVFSFITLGWICLLAFLTPIFKDIMISVKEILTWAANGFKNPYSSK